MESHIVTCSEELLRHNDECLRRFSTDFNREDVSFFDEVKPTFELIMDLASEWKVQADRWIRENKPKYIHPSQIDATIKNFEQVVLQSYYKNTNVQRFKNMHHSNQYVIESIVSGINKKQDLT
ncbi:DUF1798 family protein [Metabacillus herbersteinensis]|uniref:DUF1798 family protein n=1 Tax=Metabacillus herbersteinensis TaxID=283816 RepID=A0ABV6GD99_9BACI